MSGYIGISPVPQSTQTRDSFTATSGQTSFATGGYTPDFIDVYLNGVKLAAADYTATNSVDVVLSTGAALNDILETVAFTTFQSANNATLAQGAKADAALPKTGGAMTGAITTSSTFDGRDVATDGTKLDGIEASADVTDTTNVTSAGALMDSEVTNLAQVKAFSSADYATAAQGTTADAALPKGGGAMTGAITTNSTFDGRDVATDGAKLDGIASGATNTVTNATHTGEVTGSGALTIADNVVDEANLKVSNAPTNGYFLSAQSGNTGGMTWAEVAGGVPSGTKMMFQQTSAPTGWTKDTSQNNKALRVVSGTAGTGGSVAFTTAFASQAVGGSIANTTAGGTIANTTAGGTVAAHTLTTSEMPSHTHTANIYQSTSNTAPGNYGSGNTIYRRATATNATGGGGSHNHGFTGSAHNHGFTGSAHNHTFSGTAINLAVQYVDLIIAAKD